MKGPSKLLSPLLFLSPVFLALILTGCPLSAGEEGAADPDYIQGYTGGEISVRDALTVVFTLPLGREGEALPSPLELTPAVRGSARWLDSQTLGFFPDQPLKSGQTYRVRFKARSFAAALSSQGEGGADLGGLKDWTYTLRAARQSLVWEPGILLIPDPRRPEIMEYRTSIRAADRVSPEEAAAWVRARYNGRAVEPEILPGETNRSLEVRIPGLERGAGEKALTLRFLKAARGPRGEKRMEVPIRSRSDFSLLGVRLPQEGGERRIEVTFSQPLAADQDLRGLITLKNGPEVQLAHRSNRVTIYSNGPWPPFVELSLAPEIRDAQGQALLVSQTLPLSFPREKPAVQFAGTGVILPDSQGAVIPIQTRNLNAVMIEAVRIHSGNIPLFLQINNMDNSNQLNRVGETVWKKIIPLDWQSEDSDLFIRRGLDIQPLLENYPGGFYQLKLTFRRPHIEYQDPEAPVSEELFAYLKDPVTGELREDKLWEDYGGPVNWSEFFENRQNPLHPAYYMGYYDHNVTVSRNVFLSNIGLLALGEKDGGLTVAVTDLRSAVPLPGAEVEVYNYQNRLLAAGTTGAEGTVSLSGGGEPFLIVGRLPGRPGAGAPVPLFPGAPPVSVGNYGLLKVNSGQSRTVSHFNTGGVNNQSGVMGFFYGERGVWRPGDSIYLNFILWNQEAALPPDHPVIFTLLDPQGREVDRRVVQENTGGFYSFFTATSPQAPTGNYLARAQAGTQSFSKTIKIETIMPNRLRIGVSFAGQEDGLPNRNYSGILESSWFHGAPASRLRADISARFDSRPTVFEGFGDYGFDDPSREILGVEQPLYQGVLDEAGRAELTGNFGIEKAPGRMNLRLTTRVFEPGGAFSIEYADFPFNPYEAYLGLKLPPGRGFLNMLFTGADQKVDLVLLDKRGRERPSGRARVEIYKIDWRWWWENDRETLASYMESETFAPVSQGEVDLAGGRGSYTFKIAAEDFGRYFIRAVDLEGGHSTGQVVYIDEPGYAVRARTQGAGNPSMLVLASGKEAYDVGETVTLSLPTGGEGRGFFTVEKGGRILESRWFEGREGTTTLSFEAVGGMCPNIYVHVTYLQPHLQTANDLPIRTYGVIPISINDPRTRLKPVIGAPDSFRPEQTARITVGEENGRAMTYTLALVDEGLLGITRFRTPSPWDHFFQKEASLLKTWDLFDLVSGAYTGVLNTLLSIGGSEETEVDPAGGRPNRFAPVAALLGPVSLGPGETKVHHIPLPRYVGAVRIMVIAGTQEAEGGGPAFGSAEKEVPVRQELMILGTLPRKISINETLGLPVSLFAMEPGISEARVTLEVTGAARIEGPAILAAAFPAPAAENPGAASREGEVRFALAAGDRPGTARIRLSAQARGWTAVQEIPVEVTVPSELVYEVQSFELAPGSTWSGSAEPAGLPGTNEAILEAASLPPLDITRRLEYLLSYPHGCLEQVSSQGFAQLYLPHLQELSGRQSAVLTDNINAAIRKLRDFQLPSGGFAYWPGDTEVNTWGTNYGGHFLLEAEREGYGVPRELLVRWLDYQRSAASSWQSLDPVELRSQAYRLFTLALAGTPDLPGMNRLKERQDLENPSHWRLAMAYYLAGYRREAEEMIAGRGTEAPAFRETGGSYGSTFRDRAMILEALTLFNQRPQGLRLLEELSREMTGRGYLTTQELGSFFRAVGKFVLAAGGGGETGLTLTYRLNGAEPAVLSTGKALIQAELPWAEPMLIEISNPTNKILFPRIIARGLPAPGTESETASGLALSVRYEILGTPGAGAAILGDLPAELKQGTDLAVLIRVANSLNYRVNEIALTALMPSGWEIHNQRIGEESGSANHQDIRDDRVIDYFSLDPGSSRELRLLVNNAYAGHFYLPLIKAEAMYDPEIQAVRPGRWIDIVP
jgi:uncharacterized protein YfaS (alpha-2-macroglobulin family)